MSSKVTGLDRLLRRFEELPKEIKDNVRDIVEETTLMIQEEAIRNAPAAGDSIDTMGQNIFGIQTTNRQKINTGINQFIYAGFEVESRGLSGEVGIEAGASKLAAYIEFGTGISAAGYVPTLDPQFQAMAMRFYVNGKGTIIKHPFLLPSWFRYSPTVVPKIIESLKGLKL